MKIWFQNRRSKCKKQIKQHFLQQTDHSAIALLNGTRTTSCHFPQSFGPSFGQDQYSLHHVHWNESASGAINNSAYSDTETYPEIQNQSVSYSSLPPTMTNGTAQMANQHQRVQWTGPYQPNQNQYHPNFPHTPHENIRPGQVRTDFDGRAAGYPCPVSVPEQIINLPDEAGFRFG